MADGYYRATRKVPALVTTSVGPGATNLATAFATAFIDSSSFIALTGQIQTYLFGMGIFQEIERKHWVDYANGMSHFVKRAWTITSTKQLPRVLPNAWKVATTGRVGPVLIELPMDIQAEKVHLEMPNPQKFIPRGRVFPDEDAIREAARLLLTAERPVILIGGGIVMSDATPELIEVAEFLGAPVVGSFRGDSKSGFPGDHELYCQEAGDTGSAISNHVTLEADVLLAVGVAFSDETTSSYKRGVTFNIPPTKLVHIDIDGNEIGKNYPVEVGIVSDAKAGLSKLASALKTLGKREDYHNTPWFSRLKKLKEEWDADLKEMRTSAPMGMPNLLKVMRELLPKDAILTVSAGIPQAVFSQQWISYGPHSFLSSGGFSTMGFALPVQSEPNLRGRIRWWSLSRGTDLFS